jgi:hypothetical protein
MKKTIIRALSILMSILSLLSLTSCDGLIHPQQKTQGWAPLKAQSASASPQTHKTNKVDLDFDFIQDDQVILKSSQIQDQLQQSDRLVVAVNLNPGLALQFPVQQSFGKILSMQYRVFVKTKESNQEVLMEPLSSQMSQDQMAQWDTRREFLKTPLDSLLGVSLTELSIQDEIHLEVVIVTDQHSTQEKHLVFALKTPWKVPQIKTLRQVENPQQTNRIAEQIAKGEYAPFVSTLRNSSRRPMRVFIKKQLQTSPWLISKLIKHDVKNATLSEHEVLLDIQKNFVQSLDLHSVLIQNENATDGTKFRPLSLDTPGWSSFSLPGKSSVRLVWQYLNARAGLCEPIRPAASAAQQLVRIRDASTSRLLAAFFIF